MPVTIVEMAQEALDRGTGVMRKNYEASAAKGRMTADQVEAGDGAAEADARASTTSPIATSSSRRCSRIWT